MQPDTEHKVKKPISQRPSFFHNQKRYFALFKNNGNAIQVEFPDLPGCVASGSSWEDAISTLSLSNWLADTKSAIKEPSSRATLEHLSGNLIPIAIGEKA
jgi:predicted RNase H-like HicB family nuclease